jgi:hypothetical protein
MVKDRRSLVALVLVLAGCIDVEGGHQATYQTPCGTFAGLLLCDRESGGADPDAADAGVGAATCETACEVIVTCSFDDPAQCLLECESQNVSQSVLDCIVTAGCDFPNICFGPIEG